MIGSFNAFESSFVFGSEITLTAPDEVSKLWLAVKDLDAGYADNSGKGFEVELATLPALRAPVITPQAAQATLAAPIVLPQVNITATSTARVTVGQDVVYNLLTNHGGVTYQFLVTEPGVTDGTGPEPKGIYYILLVLLALLVLFVFGWKWAH